jgi:acetylglutamate kinase
MSAQQLQPHITKAAVLIEALPYLQAFRGETFLIKMGGSAMDDPELVRKVMRDIVFLEVAGIRPIVVHGGGKAISAAMAASGLEAKFLGGLRVTTPEAIAIVEKTLSGTINPQLAKMIVDFGGRAIGVPGTKVFVGETISGRGPDGQAVDIGRVGQVTQCRMEVIDRAHDDGVVPVISPLAAEAGTGEPLNVNADLAAAALAKQRRVAKLIYLSDVPGLLADPSDPGSLIHSITGPQARDLIADGTISGGMIPKIQSALDALENGVRKVHFIDGRVAHTLLLEIFTQSGIGTEIVR